MKDLTKQRNLKAFQKKMNKKGLWSVQQERLNETKNFKNNVKLKLILVENVYELGLKTTERK